MPAELNQKGGPPEPYPPPNPQLPTPNMTGIGKPPPPEDTSHNRGVREKNVRTRMYRGGK